MWCWSTKQELEIGQRERFTCNLRAKVWNSLTNVPPVLPKGAASKGSQGKYGRQQLFVLNGRILSSGQSSNSRNSYRVITGCLLFLCFCVGVDKKSTALILPKSSNSCRPNQTDWYGVPRICLTMQQCKWNSATIGMENKFENGDTYLVKWMNWNRCTLNLLNASETGRTEVGCVNLNISDFKLNLAASLSWWPKMNQQLIQFFNFSSNVHFKESFEIHWWILCIFHLRTVPAWLWQVLNVFSKNFSFHFFGTGAITWNEKVWIFFFLRYLTFFNPQHIRTRSLWGYLGSKEKLEALCAS